MAHQPAAESWATMPAKVSIWATGCRSAPPTSRGEQMLKARASRRGGDGVVGELPQLLMSLSLGAEDWPQGFHPFAPLGALASDFVVAVGVGHGEGSFWRRTMVADTPSVGVCKRLNGSA